MVQNANITETISWANVISIFVAVIAGLLLYILKDWLKDRKQKKGLKKAFRNELSFNVAQLSKLKKVIADLKNAVDNNQGKLSYQKFAEGNYNAIFTYSNAIFVQLVSLGVVFELLNPESLTKLDTIYKDFQSYSTTGNVINELVQSVMLNAGGVLSTQENNLWDYVLLDNFVKEINENISFITECKSMFK